MKRLLAAWCLALAGMAVAQPAPPKVLRYAFEVAETSLDPVKLQDLYSRILTAHVFEAPYTYDHLARPARLKPLTADGMPEHSADYTVWTVRIRPGIFFADDPAFRGKPRELVAQDYVYTFQRFADPANRAPAWASLETLGLVGLAAQRQRALDGKQPFDYDAPIAGLRALDRRTLRFELTEPRPRFVETLAQSDLFGAVAREVVQHYGEGIDAHPVGTGPFKLAQWRRSSFLAFDRNPGYRERFYDGEPAADDAEGQALLAQFKGRRLPMIDRVEISVIEEEQPRWLSFVNGEADLAYRVGYQFVPQAMPNGQVAPNLAKRGMRGYPIVETATNFFFFNMEDPVVGGYTPEKVALRRAIGLSLDTRRLIDHAYSGMGRLAQMVALPHTSAWSPNAKAEYSDHDPARANALLDLYGYRDRDGDGFRELPDGTPLLLRINTQQQQRDRKINEVLKKSLDAVGVRTEMIVAQWPENLKAARSGKLMFWGVALSAASYDAVGAYARYDGRQIGGQNIARFNLPAATELFRQLERLPDGPERERVFAQAEALAVAYMPYKYTLNRLSIDMAQPQLVGYRRPVFWNDWWQYVDIDPSLRHAR